MAAVPSIGRAVRVEGAPAPEADLTRALYEQYANQIFRYCLHQLGSREEAEDAVQSTFLNAFRGIKRGVVPELESAWLFKIANNVCLSRRRTSWRRGRIESPTDFDVVEEMTPAPSRRADELIGLQDVLEQMPETQRRAILLREWQGLSYREIGEELELSQAAVETLIFRARRSLAAGLERPSEAKKRKFVRGADLGNILAGIKSLLVGGGAAAKVAATVAVVSAGTVVAATPVEPYQATSHRPVAPASAPASSTAHPSAGASPSVAGPAASFAAAGARHGAKAPGPATAGHFGSLGTVTSASLSQPDGSIVAAPATEPDATPLQVTLQPSELPHPATPHPATSDKSKTEGTSAPSSKNDDLGGDGNSGQAKKATSDAKKSSEAAVTPPVTTTLATAVTTPTMPPPPAVTATTRAPSSSKSGESKGNGDAKSASPHAPAPALDVTQPTTVTLPVELKDRPKDSGKEK